MIDQLIQQEMNKIMCGVSKKEMPPKKALFKLDLLTKRTSSQAPKGTKRSLKNQIFRNKKIIKFNF